MPFIFQAYLVVGTNLNNLVTNLYWYHKKMIEFVCIFQSLEGFLSLSKHVPDLSYFQFPKLNRQQEMAERHTQESFNLVVFDVCVEEWMCLVFLGMGWVEFSLAKLRHSEICGSWWWEKYTIWFPLTFLPESSGLINDVGNEAKYRHCFSGR